MDCRLPQVIHGDSRDVLKTLADCSVDSCCTDPPYALVSIVKRFGKSKPENEKFAATNPTNVYRRASSGFMGQQWDTGETAFDPEFWREVLRVLKPGAHLVAFSGTRTYHRMACAIEDAGFEIREMHAWLYGSGFPKSHDISKAIDRASGAERPVVGVNTNGSGPNNTKLANHTTGDTGIGYMDGSGKVFDITKAASDEAKQWEGWGTATKPAMEPLCLARKPLSEKTVAANVLRWGTGALNIDGCRIGYASEDDKAKAAAAQRLCHDDDDRERSAYRIDSGPHLTGSLAKWNEKQNLGRWPANVIHDGSDEVVGCFPQTDSTPPGNIKPSPSTANAYGQYAERSLIGHTDSGSAARFFYAAKADASDRISRIVSEVRVEWISENGPCQVTLQVDTGQSPEKAIVVSASVESSRWNTFLSGSTITDLSRQASKFIIETATNSTTESKIWNSLIHSLTNDSTADVSYATANGGSRVASVESGVRSVTIILAKTASLLGVSHALSGTPLKISVSEKRHGHPTVKPVTLIQWLVRLVTPPKGTVLDCFAGTGTTGEAAWREGFRSILIEREERFVADIRSRIELMQAGPFERAGKLAKQEAAESLPLFAV